MTDEEYAKFLEWRDIETPCGPCGGSGIRQYSSTATWHGGMGGQAMTKDVCDRCWGSGDANKPWANLRNLRNTEDSRIRKGALEILANSAGCNLLAMHPAVEDLCKELDRLSRGRKERAKWFGACCLCLAKTLRAGIDAYQNKKAPP